MDSAKKNFKKLYDLILKEQPQKADVIIWLQGDRYDRASKVLELFKKKWGERILLTGNNILIEKRKAVGESNVSLNEMRLFLLKKRIEKKYLIMDDKSMNTRDQAENVIQLAKAKDWKKIILVASSYHQPRAFLAFLKQAEKIKWNGEIINQPAIIAWMKKPAGRDKTAKILFDEEREKVKKYKNDLASITRGIRYLNTAYEK